MNSEPIAIAERFEAERKRLRGVAYRLLGSAEEADDAVQEAWLRIHSSEARSLDNPSGWLTTVVARIALDMLRSRKSRQEEQFKTEDALPRIANRRDSNPEENTILAESVGVALLVVLETLQPAERLAFVLHDLFGMSFEEIAAIVGKSTAATRQMVSRARRRVRGQHHEPNNQSLDSQKRIVTAFVAAAREGKFEALLQLLDPDVKLTLDETLLPLGTPRIILGASHVAARARTGVREPAAVMLIDGRPGIVVAPSGVPERVLTFAIADEVIVEIEVIASPLRLRSLHLELLDRPA